MQRMEAYAKQAESRGMYAEACYEIATKKSMRGSRQRELMEAAKHSAAIARRCSKIAYAEAHRHNSPGSGVVTAAWDRMKHWQRLEEDIMRDYRAAYCN